MVSSGLKLSAVLAVAVIGVVFCEDVLDVTVDNVLKEVCVNGARVPDSDIPNYDVVRFFDHILLPPDWNAVGDGCIAVLASNTNPVTASGILGCLRSDAAPTAWLWKCAPKHEVGGCCKSCERSLWNNPATSNLRTYKPNQKHNRDYIDKLRDKCHISNEWVWDKHRKQPNVCCIMRMCANLCKNCSKSGAGYCDDGMCMFGRTGIPNPPASHTCNFKCCVETRAYKDDTLFPRYVMKNAATGVVKTRVCEKAYCLMLLDLEKCDVLVVDGEVQHYEFVEFWESVDVLNIKNVVEKYKNVPFFDLQSGSSEAFLPWISIGYLRGNAVPGFIDTDPVIYDRLSFASVCMTGYNGGTVVDTDEVITLVED